MKISDRFTDYGLIGGFFCIVQLALMATLGTGGFSLTAQVHKLQAAFANTPQAALPSLAALLGALALIAIFTIGLLLDLLGALAFRGDEMRVFLWHARRNEIWMQKLIDKNKDYIQNDWSVLLNLSSRWSLIKKTFFLQFMILSPRKEKVRKEYAAEFRDSRTSLHTYTRMQSFLLSYVLLVSGVQNLELLSTQLSLWNASRAISMAMFLAATEAFFIVLFAHVPALFAREPSFDFGIVLAFLVLFGFALVATAVTRAAYARACSTIFSLVYVTHQKSSGEEA